MIKLLAMSNAEIFMISDQILRTLHTCTGVPVYELFASRDTHRAQSRVDPHGTLEKLYGALSLLSS